MEQKRSELNQSNEKDESLIRSKGPPSDGEEKGEGRRRKGAERGREKDGREREDRYGKGEEITTVENEVSIYRILRDIARFPL